MTSRREFVGVLLGAFSGTAFAVDISSAALTSDLAGDCDAARLAKWIGVYGADTVATHIIAIMEDGEFSLAELKRRLNREKRQAVRAAQASARRERHIGDEVLYRGPIHVADELRSQIVASGRDCRSEVNRHAVYAGEAPCDMVVAGVLYAGDPVPRDLDIPLGSRVLFDQRRDSAAAVWCGEVVRTSLGIRVHLWRGRDEWDGEDPVPSLTEVGRGRVYELSHDRQVGLLGLPL